MAAPALKGDSTQTKQPLGTLEVRGGLVHVQSDQEFGHSFTEVLLSDLPWWVQE